MNKRLYGKVKVESLRNHPAADVEALQRLLARGTDAEADPHHKHFYEVQGDGRVFYVYISPVSGAVRLAAVWGADGMPQSKPEIVRALRASCVA